MFKKSSLDEKQELKVALLRQVFKGEPPAIMLEGKSGVQKSWMAVVDELNKTKAFADLGGITHRMARTNFYDAVLLSCLYACS